MIQCIHYQFFKKNQYKPVFQYIEEKTQDFFVRKG